MNEPPLFFWTATLLDFLTSDFCHHIYTGASKYLEGRNGVLNQLLEVSLVPLPSLGRRLEGILVAAERIVTIRAGVADTIRLSARLDPDEGIDEGVAGARGRTDTETSSDDVAPVAPFETEALDGVAAGVDDGVSGHTALLEERAEGGNVALLVLALVVFGVRGALEFARGLGECVPACDVGGDAEDLLGGAGGLVDACEPVGTRF